MINTKPSETLILVDGSSYLFRAYHALPALHNAAGQPTGAIYGTINMLRKLQNDVKADYFAVVFDPKGKTTRHTLDPQYKANRSATPEELASQIPTLYEIIRAMGLPLLIVDRTEADDVIATLARQAEQEALHTWIYTGDKDLAQLVNSHIHLINTMSDTVLDEEGVQQKFGVRPEQIIDYLCLTGDSVDNIPGVPKVGPKTAAKWLNTYGSLERLIAASDAITGKIGGYLREHIPQFPHTRALVTLRTDINVGLQPKNLVPTPPAVDTLRTLYQSLGFTNWLSELNATQTVQTPYETVLTETQLYAWIARLESSEAFAFDTETNSLDPLKATLVGFSLSVAAGKAAYIPVNHDGPDCPKQLDCAKVLECLRPLLENPKRLLIGQNLKYDRRVMLKYGITLAAPTFDTMLASYVLNSTAHRHNLETLGLTYLGKTLISFEKVAGKGKQQKTFNAIPLEAATQYAAEDADVAWQLYQRFAPMLALQPHAETLFRTIDIPLSGILARMEHHGVLIDPERLQQQSKDLEKRIQALATTIQDIVKIPINLHSPKQLQTVLFENLGLPVITRTPKGQASTSESALSELSIDYPIASLILEHRHLSKLKSTYTDGLLRQRHTDTGRVHCTYHQAVTATGRLSASDPNIQNIPIRTPEGRKIRSAFIAPPGHVLLSADYSQIELRIMAHFSEDPRLIQAFLEKCDIHKATAAEIFGLPMASITAEHRRLAKAINFGLLYGMSAFGLAKQLKIARSEAQSYIDQYFARYSGVIAYIEQVKDSAREQGYVTTLLGRRLYLPDIRSSNTQRRQAAERAAINAPMQGTAADIIKIAMIAIDQQLQQEPVRTQAQMIMQVHDELVFEVPQDPSILRHTTERIIASMENTTTLRVPLIVDVQSGKHW